jgi:transcriptional regulator with XRE-family HTH domain
MGQYRRGRPSKLINPDSSHAARLGFEIRKRRQDQGLTLKALSERIGFSLQHVSGVELGKTLVSGAFVSACDRELKAEGAILALLPAVMDEYAMQRDERNAARQQSQEHDASRYGKAQKIASDALTTGANTCPSENRN